METTEPRERPESCLNNLSCSLYQVEVQVREDGKLHRTPRLIRDGVLEEDMALEMSDCDCSLSVSRKEVSDGRGTG